MQTYSYEMFANHIMGMKMNSIILKEQNNIGDIMSDGCVIKFI